MTATAHVPQLRFPEFSGEWVEKKLGNLLEIKSASRVLREQWTTAGVPFFRTSDVVSAYKGQKNDEVYITMELFSELSKKSGRTKKNDILVTGGGSIGIPYLVKDDSPLYFKDADLLWFRITDELNGFYLYTFFLTDVFKSYLNGITHTGTISHYTIEQAKDTPINLPTLPEQTKIAAFLSAVDTKIDQLTQKKTLLETYKKGAMQQIFSQQIRFKADDGGEYPDWEEKKLGEVLDYLQPTPYLVASTEYDDSYDTPVLTAGKTFILGYTNEIEGIFSKNLPVIIFDDFTTDSKYVDFEFKAKSSAMKILVGKSDISVKFVFEAMQQIKYEVGGHGRHWISVFSQMMMLFPCPEEQTKIANFLSAIDRKIDLVSQQLEQAKAFKKGLLQQMFV